MDSYSLLFALSITLVIIYWLLAAPSSSSKGLKIPGPPSHPIVGHTFQVPQLKTWRYFEKLSHEYGPIVKLKLAGDETVILSDAADAEELLGRRSHNYSSRPQLVYAGKYLSKNMRMVLLPYNERFKKYRAAFHQMLQPRAVSGYNQLEESESLRLLADVSSKPDDLVNNCDRFGASLVFNLCYGATLNDDGKDLTAVQEIVENFIHDTYPGAHLVDTLPFLDRLPDFLAPWRAEAKQKFAKDSQTYTRLINEVKSRMDANVGLECFSARLYDQQEKMNLSNEELAYLVGVAFEAGTETTASSILWFLMAMVLYPETLRRAHQELDSICDAKTIPGFVHMEQLPYCFALVKEVMRWAPAAPGGFPHTSDGDDVYKGYFIRKGTMVIPCIWSMHRNEAQYPNAYKFDPERFLTPEMREGEELNESELTQGHYGFGFGRRKCPGQYLAAKSAWIAMVRLLWAFNIEPAKDASGNTIKVDPDDCTSGITSRPANFLVKLIPRSEQHQETIASGLTQGR
ncbi:cytochrome P450 [Favolaschia claudopus]|uniref:Cytochrome P450 n=1 Tax=Favolaschia claudopus TaxID=2862362 RepID=A0AAW0CYD9_9AGAR